MILNGDKLLSINKCAYHKNQDTLDGCWKAVKEQEHQKIQHCLANHEGPAQVYHHLGPKFLLK